MLFPVCLQKQQSVLMSVITGEAVASLRTMDDKQVLQQCMGILRELFKEQVRLEAICIGEHRGVKAGGHIVPDRKSVV